MLNGMSLRQRPAEIPSVTSASQRVWNDPQTSSTGASLFDDSLDVQAGSKSWSPIAPPPLFPNDFAAIVLDEWLNASFLPGPEQRQG